MLREQGLSMNEISAEHANNDAANTDVIIGNANESSNETQVLDKS